MEYFTEKGVLQVLEKFKKEIGKEFLFDDSEIKRKLFDIVTRKTEQVKGGFLISFQADNCEELLIDKFMLRNNLLYNFYDFEIISKNI